MSAVSEIMSQEVVTIDGSANLTVLDVVNTMVKNKVGSVIVLTSGKPAGIITERDILRKISAYNKSPREVPAMDVISAPLMVVRPFDSVDTAVAIMSKNKVKRLPVVEKDGALVGIISVSNIAKKLGKILADDDNRYRSLKTMLEI